MTLQLDQEEIFQSSSKIHYSASSGDLKSLECLVETGCDVNSLDADGQTPLHLVVKAAEDELHVACLTYLLAQKNLELNVPDRWGCTPVHWAAVQSNVKMLKTLLCRTFRLDLDSFRDELTKENFTARQKIIEKYPHLEKYLPPIWGSDSRQIEPSARHRLAYLLRIGQENSFCELFSATTNTERVTLLFFFDGAFTYLQRSCQHSCTNAVQLLLKHGADVNLAPFSSPRPIYLAIQAGNTEIMSILLQQKALDLSPKPGNETVLHQVFQSKFRSKEQRVTALKWLIRKSLVDINAQDNHGKSPLHYAVQMDDKECVLELLNNGAYIGLKDHFGETPLSSFCPNMLKDYLDSKISTNEKHSRDKDYGIIFNFRFLATNVTKHLSSSNTLFTNESSLISDEVPRNLTAKNRWLPKESSYQVSLYPLIEIWHNPKLRHLLSHPVFTALIFLKWRQVRGMAYSTCFHYSLFSITFSTYIIYDEREGLISDIIRYTLVASTSFMMYVHTSRIFDMKCKFFVYLENWGLILVVMIAAPFFLLYDALGIDFISPKMYEQIGAMAVVMTWIIGFLFVRIHPYLSLYIEMFRTTMTFLFKFLFFHFGLIIAFSLSFYILFRDSPAEGNPFRNVEGSLFKTMIMFGGDYDIAVIPFDDVFGVGHIVFILFLFFVPIVLYNLITALAVSSTKPIEENASLYRCMSQVMTMHYFESSKFYGENPFNKILRRVRWNQYLLSKFINLMTLIPPTIIVFPNKKNFLQWNQFQLKMDPDIMQEAKKLIDNKEYQKEKNKEDLTLKEQLNAMKNEIKNDLEVAIRQMLKSFLDELNAKGNSKPN